MFPNKKEWQGLYVVLGSFLLWILVMVGVDIHQKIQQRHQCPKIYVMVTPKPKAAAPAPKLALERRIALAGSDACWWSKSTPLGDAASQFPVLAHWGPNVHNFVRVRCGYSRSNGGVRYTQDTGVTVGFYLQ